MIIYRFKTELSGERTKYSNAVFTTGDVRGYRLVFEFTQNGKKADISGCMLSVKAKRADGIVIIDSGVVTQNEAYYDVKNSMIATAGDVSFEVALADSDGMYLTALELIAFVREGHGESNLKGADTTPVLSTLLTAASRAEQSANEAKEMIEKERDFVVNVVISDDGSITADKTYEEIKEALSENKKAVAYLNAYGITGVSSEMWISERHISFSATLPTMAFVLMCNDEDSWDYVQTTFASLKNNNYPYKIVDGSSGSLDIASNTVTYIQNLAKNTVCKLDYMYSLEIASENVIIVDLSSLGDDELPTITFNASVKWLGGNIPELKAGKIYLFSFVAAFDGDNSDRIYLGIGGEFA